MKRSGLNTKTPTIITGCVRSGTTLALRIYAKDLYREEERVPSAINEPEALTRAIRLHESERIQSELVASLNNRLGIVKSPHLGFVLPEIDSSSRIIAIYRDLRQVIPSMLEHENVRKYDLESDYWHEWCNTVPGTDAFTRSLQFAVSLYESILRSKGKIELWNYGFWGEWEINAQSWGHLYSREGETSARVRAGLGAGSIFSNASMNLIAWKNVCRDYNLSSKQIEKLENENQRLKVLFRQRKFAAKLVEDWSVDENLEIGPLANTDKGKILEKIRNSNLIRKKLQKIKEDDPNIYPLF